MDFDLRGLHINWHHVVVLGALVCGVAAVARVLRFSAVRLSRLSKMGFPHRHDYAIAMTVIALVTPRLYPWPSSRGTAS